MGALKREIGLYALLQKGSRIVANVPGKYTVMDRKINPVVRLAPGQARPLISVCKKLSTKQGIAYWVLERRLLQQLHHADWRYKMYRKSLNEDVPKNPDGTLDWRPHMPWQAPQ